MSEPNELERIKAYAEWACGDDSGVSSLTILTAITGVNFLGRWDPSTPRDRGDFGRCYRLIERFPELAPQLGKVVAAHPEWTALVGAWPKLSALYVEQDGARLYEEIKKVRDYYPDDARTAELAQDDADALAAMEGE